MLMFLSEIQSKDARSLESRKNENKNIQKGMNFVIDAFFSIFVSAEQRREIEANEKKEGILNFIRTNKGATIAEISDKFNISLDTSLLVLEKLEKEKKIKLNY